MMYQACRLFVASCLSMITVSAAIAGTLDPRLAALLSTKAAHTRSMTTPVNAPLSPFSPRFDSAGRVQVYIHAVSAAAPLPQQSEITALGGVNIVVSTSMRVIQAWVPVSSLKALAALPDVGRVSVPDYARIPRPMNPPHSPQAQAISPHAQPRAVTTGLAIDADAVQAMQAEQLQGVFATGAGIKVGVISGDASGNADSQAAGYLPANVFCVASSNCSTPSPGDPAEGTAMLEEVHAMAPNATLGFCGPNTTVDFLTCYQDLANWGANVIIDDLWFPSSDPFTIGATADGNSFTAAINQITTANTKVAFVSSAGNDAQDYYQAPYTVWQACTVGGHNYNSCMDFGTAIGQSSNPVPYVQFLITQQYTVGVAWNDPVGTRPDEFVLYLVDSSANVLATGIDDTAEDGRPISDFQYTPATVGETDYFVLACVTCTNPVTIKLIGTGDGADNFEYLTPGSIGAGQKVASGVLATVAAGVNAQAPLSVGLEPYSGIGPYLYGDYGATHSLAKPDILGIDSVITSGAGGFSGGPTPAGVHFCGTSATSPNVGALIADLMQANPGQVSSFYYNALENTANQTVFTTSSYTACNSNGNPLVTGYTSASAGAGLAQGYAALQSFYTFPSTAITIPVSVANGAIGSYTVPVNTNINFSATVTGGTNSGAPANCGWLAGTSLQNATPSTGASVEYTFPSVGTYTVQANCPDTHGIGDPTPPQITISAQNLPPPTAAISGTSNNGFKLVLTGSQPLTVSAVSSNTVVLPNSAITVSNGCGISSLTCSVSLSAPSSANGTATVTVTATDPFARSASANTSVTYTPPKSGGGGALGLLSLGLLGFFWGRRHRRENRTEL